MSDSNTKKEEKVEMDPQVRLSAERTLLAWIRTGLSLMGFGFVVARFGVFLKETVAKNQEHVEHGDISVWIGTALVMVGVLVSLLTGVQHYRGVKRLQNNKPYIEKGLAAGLITFLVTVLGITMSVYLIQLGLD